MTNPIENLMVADGPSVFYDEGFKIVLDSHMTYLRTHPSTSILAVTAQDAYRFEGDFYGLLHSFDVPPQYHWLIMRVNDMTSSADLKASLKRILVPTVDVIENIRQLYMISHKIS